MEHLGPFFVEDCEDGPSGSGECSYMAGEARRIGCDAAMRGVDTTDHQLVSDSTIKHGRTMENWETLSLA